MLPLYTYINIYVFKEKTSCNPQFQVLCSFPGRTAGHQPFWPAPWKRMLPEWDVFLVRPFASLQGRWDVNFLRVKVACQKSITSSKFDIPDLVVYSPVLTHYFQRTTSSIKMNQQNGHKNHEREANTYVNININILTISDIDMTFMQHLKTAKKQVHIQIRKYEFKLDIINDTSNMNTIKRNKNKSIKTKSHKSSQDPLPVPLPHYRSLPQRSPGQWRPSASLSWWSHWRHSSKNKIWPEKNS